MIAALALELLFYTVAVFGLCYILGHARVSLRIRVTVANLGGVAERFVQLVECPACLGFWIGLTAGFVWPHLAPLGPSPLGLALWTCGTGYMLGRATGWIREEWD